MRRPRTPDHFPRMKIRGARRRALHRPGYLERHLVAFAEAAGRAATLTATQMAEALAVVGQAFAVDAYLLRLGRSAPADSVECPTWFTWSAFGAPYMDTQCDGGLLLDLDSLRREDPCPMCNAASFYEHQFGGAFNVPTCARCERMLPTGTALQWHELGRSLSASAACPSCEKRTWTLMRDYGETLGERTPEWHPAEAEVPA